MFNFILNFSLSNMLGGRWASLWNNGSIDDNSYNGKAIFRAIIPALAAGFFAAGFGGFTAGILVVSVVVVGSIPYYVFGWSFDEMNGSYDPSKYPNWIKRIGLFFVSLPATPRRNMARGIIMKGLRGLFDYGTFVGLAFVHFGEIHTASFYIGGGTALMGLVYWAVGRVMSGSSRNVLCAELVYGAYRGWLIANAIIM